MDTKIDCMINDFLTAIPLQDDLDGNLLRTLLDDVRAIYHLDCIFVFENLTFRNDFVYSYYSVDYGYENKLGTIIQFTDAEYVDRLQMYDEENLYMCYEKNRNTGVLESKMRYGFITGETYYGSVGFICFHDRDWNAEEREALKKLGRILRVYLDSKYRRRLREERSQRVLHVLGQDFDGIYYINIIGNQIQTINANEYFLMTRDIQYYDDFVSMYESRLFLNQDKQRFLERFSRESLRKSLTQTSSIEDCFCVGTKEQYKWERLHAILSDTDGQENVYHVALTITDVTKEHEQIEELNRKIIEADQAKIDFLAQMSHDIRTLMNAVIGYVQLAKLHPQDIQKQSACISKIESSGKLLVSLLNDILDFSKIESGKLEIMQSAINLHDCVQESIELFTANAAAKKLNFVINNQLDEKLIAFSDPVRLSQIFNNLISNAIKYTEHGTVTVDAYLSPEKDQLLFCCTDTGIGMDEDFLAHLCDPYVRYEKDVHRQSGTGLGMSITNNLIRLMNGSMEVKSQKSKGTAVVVAIPVTLSSEETIEPDNDNIVERELSGKHILVTDDNELNREIAVELISSLRIIVETASDGADAIRQLSEHAPGYYDLILMDVQMPVLDGYEATKAIRSMKCQQLSEIPIIAMTANAYSLDMNRTKEAGMNAHLCKPIDLKTLTKLMYKYIE